MKVTNKYGMPNALVRAVTNDPYTYTGNISVTQMISPPRLRWLLIRHYEELEEDATDRIWTLLGSAVHAILERAEDKHSDDLQEVRLEAETNGWVWSGQADIWQAPDALMDYKVTGAWATMVDSKPEWEAQLNLLAFLYRHAGFPVTKLNIVAIIRDWTKFKMMQSDDYPRRPATMIDIPLWSDLQCEEYAFKRIALHKRAEALEDNELPLCTPEEMWEKPTKYAVMKDKNKRATRVVECAKEAEELLAHHQGKQPKAKFKIVERKGERTRCLHYCAVSYFCNQYNEYIGLEEENG